MMLLPVLVFRRALWKAAPTPPIGALTLIHHIQTKRTTRQGLPMQRESRTTFEKLPSGCPGQNPVKRVFEKPGKEISSRVRETISKKENGRCAACQKVTVPPRQTGIQGCPITSLTKVQLMKIIPATDSCRSAGDVQKRILCTQRQKFFLWN